MAYVVAGLKALRENKTMITVEINGQTASGELILIGNGKLYGGSFEIFPEANLQDRQLHVCVIPRTDFKTLFRIAPSLLLTKRAPEKLVGRFIGTRLELKSDRPAALELDGEWAGHLPATLTLETRKLRMAVP